MTRDHQSSPTRFLINHSQKLHTPFTFVNVRIWSPPLPSFRQRSPRSLSSLHLWTLSLLYLIHSQITLPSIHSQTRFSVPPSNVIPHKKFLPAVRKLFMYYYLSSCNTFCFCSDIYTPSCALAYLVSNVTLHPFANPSVQNT